MHRTIFRDAFARAAARRPLIIDQMASDALSCRAFECLRAFQYRIKIDIRHAASMSRARAVIKIERKTKNRKQSGNG